MPTQRRAVVMNKVPTERSNSAEEFPSAEKQKETPVPGRSSAESTEEGEGEEL
ncbi:hypothetical protein GCK32_013548 [Trichostrongylus colubriformis]|uniref:Uncharacterized protein n=1 Tax=Trichostrongylus colubriformis TaxID=6319 RepID=A0AAN8FKY2_TRICO